MKFGFKGLKAEIRYTVIDVNTLRKRDGSATYELRAVLSSEQEGEQIFEERYANVQFGRQLRVGVTWIGDNAVRSDDILVVDLPNWLGRAKSYNLESTKYIHPDYLQFGRFRYKETPPEYYNQRLIVFVPKYPLKLNDVYVKFIVIPTYELSRYFLFGANKYNELLIEGTIFNEDKSNKIYNPERTGVEKDEDGKEYRYIQIRKEVPDSSVPLIGDFICYEGIKELAGRVIGEVNKGTNPFFIGKFPIPELRSIRAYGRFTKNKDGDNGFEILSFATIDFGERYLYGRDNDGRSTSKRNNSMKKIFGGKKKNKQKKKKKENIDHEKLGDPNMESESLGHSIDNYEWEDRKEVGIKVLKTDQKNIAGDKTPGDNVDPNGKAAMSGNGERGSNIVPVDNDIELEGDAITEKKYWEKFPEIIKHLSNELGNYSHSIRYFSNDLTFVPEEVTSNFEKVLKNYTSEDFYLVELNMSMFSFYIMEVNPEKYEVPTMVFWDNSGGSSLGKGQIEVFLNKYFENNGVPKQIAAETLNDFEIGYGVVKHQYFVNGSNQTKRLKFDASLKNQGVKLAKLILLNFR
ncbi:hypothetical protein [Fluviicola taffensis]|uniref:hypothetical protein n=1 Tax=Fluviicola taffensis TaxID=191579 RepID=UPI0031380AC9